VVHFALGTVVQESSELRDGDLRSRPQEHLEVLPFPAIPGHLDSWVLVVPVFFDGFFEFIVAALGLRSLAIRIFRSGLAPRRFLLLFFCTW
jgi:hypothetical protein